MKLLTYPTLVLALVLTVACIPAGCGANAVKAEQPPPRFVPIGFGLIGACIGVTGALWFLKPEDLPWK